MEQETETIILEDQVAEVKVERANLEARQESRPQTKNCRNQGQQTMSSRLKTVSNYVIIYVCIFSIYRDAHKSNIFWRVKEF